MKNWLLICVVSLLAFSCGERKPEDFTQDKALFEYADKLLKDGEYTQCIPFFENLKNRFPQSPYAAESELKVADAHFEKGEFVESEVIYRNFRTLHPANDKVPYAVFQMGMSQFRRKPSSIDRDQSDGQSALSTFTELTNMWPNSKEAKEAKPYIEKCKRSLVEREIYVGQFYIKQKKYAAAIARLKPVAETSEFEDLKSKAKQLLSKVQ